MQLPIVFATVVTLAAGHPGLLKVPKVYNAVITSNQNLSPSRAFPVIQPVIHRTAVGYVPPIYYPQVAPEIPGPGLVHLSRNEPSPSNRAEVQSEGAAAAPVDLPVDVPVNLPVDAPVDAPVDTPVNTPADAPKVPEPKKVESSVENGQPKPGPRNRHDEQPLSFYPNYQSLYYDPYFYTYSGINPHLVPGTYYVDYQPYGTLDPIPASTPKNGDPGHLLPGYHEERKDPATADKPKVPDVPPPPLPTAAPKDS